MAIALSVQDLWKCYAAGVRGCSARVWVLRGCSLEIADGERVALVGPAATGKSTLLRCIAGWLRADVGRVIATRGLLILDEEPVPRTGGGTILVATRNEGEVRGLVDRIIRLQEGRLHEDERATRMLVAEPSRAAVR